MPQAFVLICRQFFSLSEANDGQNRRPLGMARLCDLC